MNTGTVLGWRKGLGTNILLSSTLAGLGGGAAGGLAAGLAARAAMRAVALLSGPAPSFSLEGTAFIILFGVLLGLWPGLALGFIQALWPGHMRRRGLLLGAVIGLSFAGLLLTAPETGELAGVPRVPVAAMFATIPLLYGLVLGIIAERLTPKGAAVGGGSKGFARAAGWLTMAAALAGAASAATLALAHPAIMELGLDTTKALEQALGAATLVTMVAGVAGLVAAGGDRGGRLALGGTLAVMLGGAMLSVTAGGLGGMNVHAFARAIARPGLRPESPVTAGAVILVTLGLLAVGLAAGRGLGWTGWRRYAALAPGLMLTLSAALLHPALVPRALRMTHPDQARLGLWLGVAFAASWVAVGARLARGRPGAGVVAPGAQADTARQEGQGG